MQTQCTATNYWD